MNTYVLKTPKTVDGIAYSSLTFNELELDDVIALAEIDNNDLRALRAFLARVTGNDEKIIGRLTLADFQGLIGAATGPLGEPRGFMPTASDAS